MTEPAVNLDIDILPAPPDADDDLRDAAEEGHATVHVVNLDRDRRRPYTYTELQAECAKQRQRADDYRDALVTVFEHGRSFMEPTTIDGVKYYRFLFWRDARHTDVAVAADPMACVRFCEQQRRTAQGLAFDGRAR